MSADYDAVIVGAGAGGGVVAFVLASRGWKVALVEKGRNPWPTLAAPELRLSLFGNDELRLRRRYAYHDPLIEPRTFRSDAAADAKVQDVQPLGVVVGGGTVQYDGDSPRVTQRDLSALSTFGPIEGAAMADWPLSYEELAPFYDHAEAAVGVQGLAGADPFAEKRGDYPMPPGYPSKAGLTLAAAAAGLGYHPHPMPMAINSVFYRGRPACTSCGFCGLGCPVNAKGSSAVTVVRDALLTGKLTLLSESCVTRIDSSGGKATGVRLIDPSGVERVVTARHVIVAANAIGSAQLILRSGLGNEHTGRNLSLQPQLAVLAEVEERLDAHLGIPQSWALTQYEQEDHPSYGLYGYRIEGIMGTPGIVSTMLPWIGARGKEAMTGYTRTAGVLVLVPDGPSGSVSLTPSGRPLIRYDHQDEHKWRLRQGAREAARIYLAAGVKRVIVPTIPPLVIEHERDLDATNDLSLAPATAPLISAHQQGSLRMAPSAKDGAIDPDGQVYGTRGVYVFDSSGFPTSASTHTMTPIVTMSRWWTTRLLATL